MPGRNDRCPCGSGRKYKKCCLETAGSEPRKLVKGDARRRASETFVGSQGQDHHKSLRFTFAEIASCDGIDSLPLPELSKSSRKSAARFAQLRNFLNITPVVGHDCKLLANDCRSFEIIFEIDSEKKSSSYSSSVYESYGTRHADENDNDDGDATDHYHDHYFNRFNSERIRVVFTEQIPNGPIAISAECDGEPLELVRSQTEIDAAMVVAWMACSLGQDLRRQPVFIREIHKKFQSLEILREQRVKSRSKIDDEVNQCRLESLTVVLPSQLADGSDLRNHLSDVLYPPNAFADVAPSEKLTHADPGITEVLNWKSSEFKKFGLPDVFSTEPGGNRGYPHLLEIAMRTAESIIYNFDNGVAISAREILSHPFAVLVPPDLLPGGVTLPGAQKCWPKNFAAKDSKESDLSEGDLKKYILDRGAGRWLPWGSSSFSCDKPIAIIFQHAIQRLNNGELKLFFVFAEPENVSLSLSSQGHRQADLVPLIPIISPRSGAREKKSARSRLPIFGIDVDKTPSVKWSIQFGSKALASDPSLHMVTAEARLVQQESSGRKTLCLQNGLLDLERRTLTLKPLAEEVQTVNRWARGPDENQAPDSQGIMVQVSAATTYALTLSARGFSAVSALLGELKNEKYLGYEYDEEAVPKWTAFPEIHLARDGSFALVRRLLKSPLDADSSSNARVNADLSSNPSANGEGADGIKDKSQRVNQQSVMATETMKEPALSFIYGFSSQSLRLIRMLAEGLPSFLGTEAKEMASRNKRVRDFELKLLKHQGIVNLLLYETLTVRYRGAMSDGVIAKTPARLLQLLEIKILALMGAEAEPGVKLLDHCSKAVYGKLLKLISEFFKIDRDEVFTTFLPEGEAQIERFLDDELRLIFALLEHAALSSNGAIFARPRINLAQQILPVLQATSDPSMLPLGSEAREFSALQVYLASERKLTEAVRDRATSRHFLRLPSSSQASKVSKKSKVNNANNTDSTFTATTAISGRASAPSLQKTLLTLQPLTAHGFEFYFNGRKLKELSQNEFTTEMNLLDEVKAKPSNLEVSGPYIDQDGIQGSGEKKIALNYGRLDWFELHPKFFLHGVELKLAEAQSLMRDGMIEYSGQYYLIPAGRLPSLRKLSDFWLRLQQGKKATSESRANGQPIYHVAKSQVLEMLALRSSGIPVQGGSRWQEICSFYDSLSQRDQSSQENPNQRAKQPFVLPTTIRGQLKSYQEIGVERLYDLYRLGLGAILADDMGLGKTLQALAMLEKLRVEERLGHALIIVPTSLTYNWLSESEKFTPELPMIGFSAKTKASVADFLRQHSQGVVLTTYGLLQEHKEHFQQVKWNLAIFDEAQNLKNITAQRTTTARALNANVKICLTGTPLENHLGELYSLLDLVVPGCLGEFDQFQKTYVNAPSIVFADIEYLKLKCRPLILRRTKREILLELPEKQESRVVLPFEEKQKKIYRDIAISYNEKIRQAVADGGEANCQLQMLTALLRLRQACSSPGALPGVKYAQIPPKIEALIESLTEIVESGESALVFTQFIHTLEGVTSCLRKADIPVFELHGGMTRDQREQALQKFHEIQGGAVLVMTLKTGGVGLNLTKASYVFHLEPWWNPAVENQATDRAHRLGQKRSVQVYRYIMHDSVEEKIEKLKVQKQQRFDVMFTQSENSLNSEEELSDQDFKGSQRVAGQASHLSQADFSFLLQQSP